ncbi:hypothetical protein ACJD0Z_17550 [Flavobacteriaceae bacterium M23B6Z8]
MEVSKENISIDLRKKLFKAEVMGIHFKEGEHDILYIPSLQISAYGSNIEEADQMAKESMINFFKDISNLNESEVYKVLKDLGWNRVKYFKKKLTHLSETTFEDIKKEFNLPDDTRVEKIPIAV